MGNALICFVVPEEMLGLQSLHIHDPKTGKPVPLETERFGAWIPGRLRRQTIEKHPEAFFMLPVPYTAVWQLPEEPWREKGVNWHWRPAVLGSHRKRVRASLEDFLNRKLRSLDEMVRSGWFIIKRARVKVSELREVPHSRKEHSEHQKRARG